LGFHGYRKGDFKPLDDILELLESATITPTIEDSGNVGDPVRTYRWNYVFEDGSFEIYAGNYSGHEHRQGAFVSGFGALRSLLSKLRLREPRILKGERRPVVISLTQGSFDRMPDEMKDHLWKAFGHKAGLNPSPGFYQGPPIESAKEYYKRIQPPPREVRTEDVESSKKAVVKKYSELTEAERLDKRLRDAAYRGDAKAVSSAMETIDLTDAGKNLEDACRSLKKLGLFNEVNLGISASQEHCLFAQYLEEKTGKYRLNFKIQAPKYLIDPGELLLKSSVENPQIEGRYKWVTREMKYLLREVPHSWPGIVPGRVSREIKQAANQVFAPVYAAFIDALK
jgi:hypothetical protein